MEEVNKTDRKKHILIWVVVGIVVLAVILVPTLLSKKSNSETVITLESVNAELQAIEIRVEAAELKVGQQAEDISNLVAPKIKDIIGLEEELSDLSGSIEALWAKVNSIPNLSVNITDLGELIEELGGRVTTLEGKKTNWQSEINALSDSLIALNTTLNNLVSQVDGLISDLPAYVEVTGLTTAQATIMVHGSVDSPVLVTFYGSDFVLGAVSPSVSTYVWGGTPKTVLVAVVEGSWVDGNTIILEVTTGTVDYATATIGGGS